MSKQHVSESIENVSKYLRNFKQQKQVSVSNPQTYSEPYIFNDNTLTEFPSSYLSSMAFHKAKSKMQSTNLFKEESPVYSKLGQHSKDKKEMNMSMKVQQAKKEIQSENEREKAFSNSRSKIAIKHLSNLLPNSLGNKQAQNKKNGHSHTYTYLNQMDSDKFSQLESSYSTKNQVITRMRHSKSPSKQRHIEHNNTSYGEQDYKVSHLLHTVEKQHKQQQKKGFTMEHGFLLHQIVRLEKTIKKYKVVLIEMQHKYHQMEDQLKEKALNDHYIDVLKLQIEELQVKNYQLNVIIQKQQETINQCEHVFIDKITKINEYHCQTSQEAVKLKEQNQVLKQLLLISNDKTPIKHAQRLPLQRQNPGNAYLQTVCKSMEQFSSKWT